MSTVMCRETNDQHLHIVKKDSAELHSLKHFLVVEVTASAGLRLWASLASWSFWLLPPVHSLQHELQLVAGLLLFLAVDLLQSWRWR